MDITNPFETFQKSAFRLEALPQYLVDSEADAFNEFKLSGKILENIDSDWPVTVSKNVSASKLMKRLRLLSDELSDYEKFETEIYTGPKAGEEIRVNSRSKYINDYKYDFWMFDEQWLMQMNYRNDGTFIDFDLRKATDQEIVMYRFWFSVFETSRPLSELSSDIMNSRNLRSE